MAASIPCSVVANKVVTPTSTANVGMKRWRSIAPIRTGTTLLLMSARPNTWMTTFSTINGRLQAQSAVHALISTAFICDILSRLWAGRRNLTPRQEATRRLSGRRVRLHFGKRNCTWKRSCQSGPPRWGVTTLSKAISCKLIGSLSIFIILPKPPPIGTVQRSSLAASQFAVKALHDTYLRRSSRQGPSPEEWKESNRRQADHIAVKVRQIGCGLKKGKPDPSFQFSDEEIEKLAEIEHRRWMADRRLNGWSYGPTRDSKLGHHPISANDLPQGFSINDVVCQHLRAGRRREDVYPRLRAVLRETQLPPPEALIRLAEITDFNLYVTITFDSLLEEAINKTRSANVSY